jgi:hypothetical protein
VLHGSQQHNVGLSVIQITVPDRTLESHLITSPERILVVVRKTIALILAVMLVALGLPTSAHAKSKNGFEVESAGGSVPNIKSGNKLILDITSDGIILSKISYGVENYDVKVESKQISGPILRINPTTITGLTYGSESHHRIGTGVAVGFMSLGGGLIVACTKSKKHFIGITWDSNGQKGGIALRVDKNDYHGIITALQGVTGKTVVDTDYTLADRLGVK